MNKFDKLYKVIIEETLGINIDIVNAISDKLYSLANNVDEETLLIGKNYFDTISKETKYKLNEIEPIISGERTIKIVPNGYKDNSIIKISNISIDLLSKINLKRNASLCAYLYVLNQKLKENPNYVIEQRLFKNIDAELQQINDLNKEIAQNGGNILINVNIKDNEDQFHSELIGPFDEAEKIPGTKKADAKLIGKNTDDELYLSLKKRKFTRRISPIWR